MAVVEAEAARYFTNSRGNKQLIDSQNYVYTHSSGLRDVPGIRTYWKCDRYKICKVMATVLNDRIISVPTHQHTSNIAGLKAKLQSLEAVAKAVENPQIKPRQILAELANQPCSLAVKLARRPEASLTRAIQKKRAALRDEPPLPNKFSELKAMEIPDKYGKTKDGDQFLLVKDYISENNRKGIVLFLSPFGRQLLKRSKLWCADGTFLTAPKPFVQIYIVAAESPAGRILPASFVLLQEKHTESYTRMWEILKDQLSSDRGQHQGPDVLKVDFETACINAFEENFPEATVRSCYLFSQPRCHANVASF